jgi:hypothetical protein
MKKLSVIMIVFGLSMFLISCGSGSGQTKINQENQDPNSFPTLTNIGNPITNSGEINCPEFGYEYNKPEEAALALACDYAMSWSLSFEFISVDVIAEDEVNKTAQVRLVFNELGCGNCPQENEAIIEVFVNVDRLWESKNHGFIYHLTSTAQAEVDAAIQEQANQLAATINIVKFGSNEGNWSSLLGDWSACTQGSGVCPVNYVSGNSFEMPILLAEPKDNLCNDSVFLEIKALLPDGSEEIMEDRKAGDCEIRSYHLTDGSLLFDFYPIRDYTFCIGPPSELPECDRDKNKFPVKILAYRAVLRSSLTWEAGTDNRIEVAGDWISPP